MACGLSALQIGKIINEYVAGNKQLSSRQGLLLALKTYEYKEDGIFKKLTKDELQEIVDNYYPQYINAFNAAHSKVNKQNSTSTQKQYRRYVKSKKLASQINNGDIAAHFKQRVEEAYQFPAGEKRERMLQQLNAEIGALENPAWQALVNDWIWIRPLFSIKFILSSLIANGMASRARSIISGIRGKSAAKREMLAHRAVNNKSVLAGGLPLSSSIKLFEGGRGGQEFSIAESTGIDYANNPLLNKYFKMGGFFTKWGGRVVNWTDTNIGYHSELLYYSMLMSKETDIFKKTHSVTSLSEADKAEITRITTQKMFGNANLVQAKADATAAVTDTYRNAGYTIEDNSKVNDSDLKIGRQSPEFLRAIYERMTETKDLDVLQAANRLAARDFFKGNMNLLRANTGIEKADVGLMGYFPATFLGFAFSAAFNKHFGSGIVADKLTQSVVGFLNGASHFAENLLENTPYGLIKGAIMRTVPADSFSEQLYKNQRTNDLLLKPLINMGTTAAIYAVAKFAEAEFCKDKGQTISNEEIANAKVMTFCGLKVPAWVMGMSAANTIAMNYFINVANDKQKPSVADIAAMSYALMNVREGQQGDISEFVKKQLLGKVSKAQEKNLVSGIVSASLDAVLSPFLMFPNRPINELITTAHMGKESSPSFKFQGEGVLAEFWNIPAYAKWATYQALGIKEGMMAFTGNTAGTKFYDYRGRVTANTSASNNTTDWGIQYDKYDDLINKLDVSPYLLHNSPYKVLYDKETTPTHDLRRFMTELEYQNVQRAIGVKFNEFITEHYEELHNATPEDAKKKIENAFNDTERQSKDAVEDTPGASYEVYLSKIHIDANPRKVKHKKTHNF